MAKLIVAFRNFSNTRKNFTFGLHSVLMCFVWISEKKKRLLLLLTEMEYVYCAVRAVPLNIIQVNFSY
jgi:hypothetical protein